MRIGMVGLGRMGANMTGRLLAGGHEVVVWDRNAEAIGTAAGEGAVGADSLDALVAQLSAPRAVWIMVPSGDPTEQTVTSLLRLLGAGDVIIDGGNSNYKDSVRRAATAGQRGVLYVDAGTSGGVWGRTEGYSLMVGGDDKAIAMVRPVLETLAPAKDKGWGHVGPVGAGHFTKMVHNGIEYGLMQAFAEGFELMQRKGEFGLDLGRRGAPRHRPRGRVS